MLSETELERWLQIQDLTELRRGNSKQPTADNSSYDSYHNDHTGDQPSPPSLSVSSSRPLSVTSDTTGGLAE